MFAYKYHNRQTIKLQQLPAPIPAKIPQPQCLQGAQSARIAAGSGVPALPIPVHLKLTRRTPPQCQLFIWPSMDMVSTTAPVWATICMICLD